ncbi:hypothetical protein SNE40_013531 [Patella caerulea]|uniref:Glutathione transferase n=1 Tax=Patella caerulea TaxID=87958 RepID=A0AAN8JDN3_PATCE
MPPKYKYYFFKKYRARGELVRLVFAAAGAEYEDVGPEGDDQDWAALKPTLPTGKLPVLEIDGRMFAESVVIARYLAREFGLDGQTNYEKLLTDTIVDKIIQVREMIADLYYINDPVKKAEAQKNFIEEQLPPALSFLEKFVEKNESTGGFLVGDKVTWADLAVFDILEMVVKQNPDILAKYPKLAANFKLVPTLSRLSEYLKSRPATDV